MKYQTVVKEMTIFYYTKCAHADSDTPNGPIPLGDR